MDKTTFEYPNVIWNVGNAVYGQLYSALIVYVLLKAFYDVGKSIVPRHASLSFAQFSRLLLLEELPSIWAVKLVLLRKKASVFLFTGQEFSG